MARTLEAVIAEQLGGFAFQMAQLVARLEAAQERIAELENLYVKPRVEKEPVVKLATKLEQKSNEGP